MKTDGKNEVPRVNPAAVPLYQLQILHELHWDGTQDFRVEKPATGLLRQGILIVQYTELALWNTL
jgi:hypothetical protein